MADSVDSTAVFIAKLKAPLPINERPVAAVIEADAAYLRVSARERAATQMLFQWWQRARNGDVPNTDARMMAIVEIGLRNLLIERGVDPTLLEGAVA